jgi:hypothetical protein
VPTADQQSLLEVEGTLRFAHPTSFQYGIGTNLASLSPFGVSRFECLSVPPKTGLHKKQSRANALL